MKRRAEEPDEVWWQGRQWAVTSYGIECRDGTYPIEAKRLYERHYACDGSICWAWPVQIAGKGWEDIHDFCSAFAVALLLHSQPAKAKPFKRGEVRQVCELAIRTVERYRENREQRRLMRLRRRLSHAQRI